MTHDSATLCYVSNRPYAKDPQCKCAVCGKRFEMNTSGWKNTQIVVTEEKVSVMRGDDIVRFYHAECFTGKINIDMTRKR